MAKSTTLFLQLCKKHIIKALYHFYFITVTCHLNPQKLNYAWPSCCLATTKQLSKMTLFFFFFFYINHIHYPNFFVLLFLIVITFISNDVLNLRVDTEPYLKLPSFSSFFIYFIFSLYIF